MSRGRSQAEDAGGVSAPYTADTTTPSAARAVAGQRGKRISIPEAIEIEPIIGSQAAIVLEAPHIVFHGSLDQLGAHGGARLDTVDQALEIDVVVAGPPMKGEKTNPPPMVRCPPAQ